MTSAARRATLDDLERLVRLFDAYRQFYGQSSDLIVARRFLSDRLVRNDSVALIAEDGAGRAVGFVQLYPSFSSILAAPMYVLSDLFVIPDARRRGVGTLLLKSAVETARANGAVRVELATAITNAPAQLSVWLVAVAGSGYLQFRCSSRHVIRMERFHPFGSDGIALLHRHAGVGVEHLRTASTAPREKGEEMVFAERTRTGRSIGFLQAIRHAAACIQHLDLQRTCSVCRSAVPIFKATASPRCLTSLAAYSTAAQNRSARCTRSFGRPVF